MEVGFSAGGGNVLHGVAGTAVDIVVAGTLGLVEGLLGTTLAVVGLETTSKTVTGVSDSLLDLVLGGLGGVRSDLLLSLCGRRMLAWVRVMGGL